MGVHVTERKARWPQAQVGRRKQILDVIQKGRHDGLLHTVIIKFYT